MSSSQRQLSIKSLFVWVVMAITTLALVFVSSISLYNHLSGYKEDTAAKVEQVAEFISRIAVSELKEGNNFAMEDVLSNLSVVGIVENAHIYRLLDNGELEFFASYNKTGYAPVRAMFDQVAKLQSLRINVNSFELIRPIRADREVIGYTYIRASAKNLHHITVNAISITVAILVITLLVCLLLTLRLQRSVTRPIQKLITLVQRITLQKNYSARAEPTNIKELDILGDAFNDMLDKIQEYMQAQAEAEEEHRRLHASLEEKVIQRTTALKEANQELIQTLEKLHQFQRQLVQNEKMASLGDMVAGVAHEVNTPIGLGVTASTMMLDRLTTLEKAFESKTLKASTLSKFISEGQENLNIIYRNLNRAAELISSFKQVAVDQSSEDSRIFSFSQLMDEILLSLRPRLKKLPHDILVHCDESIYIKSKAGPINQIMINLIMNSVIHGFEFMEKGQIDIFVELVNDEKLKITYKDNGKGIPEHLRKRIFDPFVTTKRGQGGSGLGMHLVYNLITQGLNGAISITNEDELGVEFLIIFPVEKVDASQFARSS